jgi:hypothetical protein
MADNVELVDGSDAEDAPAGLTAVWDELSLDDGVCDEPWEPRRRTPVGMWAVRIGPVGEAGRRVEQRRRRIRMFGLVVVALSVLAMLVTAAFIVRQWEHLAPMLSVDYVELDTVGVENTTLVDGGVSVPTTAVLDTGAAELNEPSVRQ